jgi:LuxR family maltose regulon positive regulatory protein
MATALLSTKLFIPAARASRVTRPRLNARLDDAMRSGGKLLLVCAPAGFGKTTLLTDWLTQEQGPQATTHNETLLGAASRAAHPAWVSLDAADNDPARFWSYLLAALDWALPGVGEPARLALQAPQPPPIETLLTLLINALAEAVPRPGPVVLVLDDYHVISMPAIHAALTFLLDQLPPQLYIVLISRADPPLPLARWRARNQLVEVRAADLRFTPAEVARFFSEVMRLPLAAPDVAALETRTEGWAAGLHLAALAMQDRADPSGFVAALAGSHRFVVDYLVEEVFTRQPPHIQTFLLQTALLDRMCGPLCDAVLGLTTERDPAAAPASAGSFSQLILHELERANLFTIALDDERHWYRYHHLFADVLRSRLQSRATAAELTTLHRRASAWYEQHELLPEAVRHALTGHDWEHAASLIAYATETIMRRGQVHTLLAWLNALPDDIVRARPDLCIYHAAALMNTNQLAAAAARLQEAEQAVHGDMPADQARLLLGRVAMVRANLARAAGDLARCVTLARQALDLIPEADVMVRASAMVNAARAYMVSGDVTPEMERLAATVVGQARASGNPLVILTAITNLARLQALQGQLHRAAATYADAVPASSAQGGLAALAGSPAYYFGLGELLREWNELDAAERHLVQGMDLVLGTLTVDADLIGRGAIALARLKQARGQHAGATEALEAFANLAHERDYFAGLVPRGAAVEAQLCLAQGDLRGATYWADVSGLGADDELSFLRETEYLTLARVRIAQGRGAPLASHLHEALQLLERLLAAAEAGARMGSVIEIMMLRALARQAQGDVAAALKALTSALDLAESAGYIRLFVDEGAPMAALLAAAAHHGIAPAYVARLLAAFPSDELHVTRGKGEPHSQLVAHGASLIRLVEPLSEREREILQLVAAGHSNQVIADTLIIAIGTVKKHINNIYGKLAVSSRTQALARAHELHLL